MHTTPTSEQGGTGSSEPLALPSDPGLSQLPGEDMGTKALQQQFAAIMKRLPWSASCTTCRILKSRCYFVPGERACQLCQRQNKTCIVDAQKRLKWGADEHELLRGIASKDELIDYILNQNGDLTPPMNTSSQTGADSNDSKSEGQVSATRPAMTRTRQLAGTVIRHRHRPRPPCINCRRRRIKCVFEAGNDVCQLCQHTGKVCTIGDRSNTGRGPRAVALCANEKSSQHEPMHQTTQKTFSEIAEVLTGYGCAQLTQKLAISSCSGFPISNGGFGDTYSGRLENGVRVAIKVARRHVDDSRGEDLQHIVKELRIWSKCRHHNVLEMLGFVKFQSQIGMVSLWTMYGSIQVYLDRQSHADRLYLGCGIADGLAYLHGIKIVHGDLKGANVLVDEKGIPKLTDFGNSVLNDGSDKHANSEGGKCISPRWTAPEVLVEETNFSYETDVFSLGMTLLETITGMLPYHELAHDLAVILTLAVKKKLPGRPDAHIPTDSEYGDKIWSLITTCWAFEPKSRPSAADVRDNWKEIICARPRNEETAPPMS